MVDGRWHVGKAENQKGLGDSEPLVLAADCQLTTVDSAVRDRRYK